MSEEETIVENEARMLSSRNTSQVVLQKGELLRAVIQFLQEAGLVHSMRALEQESGLTTQPLSVEMYCLRDMALRGQWHHIFKYLSPLEGVKGVDIGEIRMKVCKQEFLEQLRGTVDTKNTFELVEHYKKLVLKLQQLSTLGLSETEHRKLSLQLTLPETALQQEFKGWSIPGARLQLADEITQLVSKVLGDKDEGLANGSGSPSSQPECDMKKESKGRLVQLMAKGLLYEKCEKTLLTDSCSDNINNSQMIDISGLLVKCRDEDQRLKFLDIVCEEEGSKKGMREKGKLKHSLRIMDEVENTSSLDYMSREKEITNNGVKLSLKMNEESDKDMKRYTRVISQSLTTNTSTDNNNNNKPPIPDRPANSVSSSNISEHNAENASTAKTTHILTTPQNDHKITRQTPTPGCDSSTPKPDKARSALTPMPDESPIQPILEYEKLQHIRNQHKHSQSLNNQTTRQRTIVRKLDLDSTSETGRLRHSSVKVADVNSLPKAVQWVVGLGRDREGNKEKKGVSGRTLGVGAVEVEMQREMKETNEIVSELNDEMSISLEEKKKYKLVLSEEKTTPNHTPVPKFEPPYLQLIGEMKDTQVVRSVCFHPTQKVIAVGANSKCLYLCQYSTNTQLNSDKQLNPFKSFTSYHKGSLYCLEWSPLGGVLASASNDQTIRVLDLPTDTPLQDVAEWPDPTEIRVHSGTVRALGFLNERLLASGGAGDTKVRLVDVNKPTDVITSLLHAGQINEVYRCSENELVTASQDEYVRIWDVRSSECVWKVSCVTPPSSVCSDQSGNKIAASCEDGTVQIFDRRNSVCFYSNKVHSKDVRSIRFKPATSDTLLTGSYDGEIKLLYPDLGTSHQIAKFAQKIIQCRFSPEAAYMVSSSTDKTVKLWEFSNSC